MKTHPARPPHTRSLSKLKGASKSCTACPLYKYGTQTVFGEGPKRARLLIVGEQPGDKEDLAGKPFVGPAGALVDGLCEELGIERRKIYVTNAVKHFKWKRAGKRRLHQKPNRDEIGACHPWLEAEVRAVEPEVILCLGVTAATSVFGKVVTITALRGRFHWNEEYGAFVVVSWHPSAILRSPTPEARADKRNELKKDLKLAYFKIRK